MPRRKWRLRGRREALTPPLERYLVTGEYSFDGVPLDIYRLAGYVIRGELTRLRKLVEQYGDDLHRAHPDVELFAERVLRDADELRRKT